MTSTTLFVATTITTAAIFTGMHLNAANPKQLAISKSPVTVNGAEVRGLLEERTNGVYGVLTIMNRTDAPIEGNLNHATFVTPAMSKFARMVPMPKEKHTGVCEFKLAPREELKHEFCIKKLKKAENPTPQPSDRTLNQIHLIQTTPATWSLVISRGKITAPGWGGMLTAPQTSTVLGDQGQLVLAHSIKAPILKIAPLALAQPIAAQP
jgi:hypothetical protein